MPDKGSQDELTLRRMPEGGFLVSAYGGRHEIMQFLFASTEIDKALEYIKGQVQPIGPQPPTS